MPSSLTKNAAATPLQFKSSSTRTPTSILRELLDSPEGFYAASPRLIRHVEYFIGGQDGNILISKGGPGLPAKEFIIRGVFEISRNDFSFTPDANFNPSNVFHGRFSDVKLSCRLTAGRHDMFRFSSEDFPDVIDNIGDFEGLIPRERDYERLSAVHVSLGQRSIKLIHGLFEVSTSSCHLFPFANGWTSHIRPRIRINAIPPVTKMMTARPVSYKQFLHPLLYSLFYICNYR